MSTQDKADIAFQHNLTRAVVFLAAFMVLYPQTHSMACPVMMFLYGGLALACKCWPEEMCGRGSQAKGKMSA